MPFLALYETPADSGAHGGGASGGLPGGAAGRRDDRVAVGCPGDFPVVAFGIGEVGIAALEELGIGGLFGQGGAGRSRPPGELVHLTRPVYGDDDRASDTRADWPGLRVCVAR